ncbi:hypothetical protein ZIOFF_056146 [Zingiber officinale]|uniref:FAF domain-containing protein n=1 Tax=Zingiber officinale TaxID=94328 RepID=A0A8J5FN85_ZINOF|nr:hypothetical protein ZIOFF_056146 [Zingiber officinale]
MLSSCSRAALAFLGLSETNVDDGRRNDPRGCRLVPHENRDGLHVLVGDLSQPPNVLVCSAVGKPPRERVDAGSRGLHDLVYVEGLRMCTEDLGSESGYRRMEAEEEEESRSSTLPWRGLKEARKQLLPRPQIPPPLLWLADGRSWFLRATREGGRIRMTEVLIEQPLEALRATREGGRLRLDLVILTKGEENNFDGGELADEGPTETTEIVNDVAEEEDLEGGDDVEEEQTPTENTIIEKLEPEVRSPAAKVVIPTARTGEDRRCQDGVSGNGVSTWWSHHNVMTT